jgi:hypothetical protein
LNPSTRVVLFWQTRADGRDALFGVRLDDGRRHGLLAHAGPAGNYHGHTPGRTRPTGFLGEHFVRRALCAATHEGVRDHT